MHALSHHPTCCNCFPAGTWPTSPSTWATGPTQQTAAAPLAPLSRMHLWRQLSAPCLQALPLLAALLHLLRQCQRLPSQPSHHQQCLQQQQPTPQLQRRHLKAVQQAQLWLQVPAACSAPSHRRLPQQEWTGQQSWQPTQTSLQPASMQRLQCTARPSPSSQQLQLQQRLQRRSHAAAGARAWQRAARLLPRPCSRRWCRT